MSLNYRQIPLAIEKRFAFNGNTMSGREYMPGMCWAGPGMLDGEERDKFLNDAKRITYAVFSYGTPIAWETVGGEVYKVNQKFSVTTSKHQGKLYLFESKK